MLTLIIIMTIERMLYFFQSPKVVDLIIVFSAAIRSRYLTAFKSF